jgi:hypothetical protein
MVETRWQVRFTLDELPVPVVPLTFVEQASSGLDEWRAVSDVRLARRSWCRRTSGTTWC